MSARPAIKKQLDSSTLTELHMLLQGTRHRNCPTNIRPTNTLYSPVARISYVVIKSLSFFLTFSRALGNGRG